MGDKKEERQTKISERKEGSERDGERDGVLEEAPDGVCFGAASRRRVIMILTCTAAAIHLLFYTMLAAYYLKDTGASFLSLVTEWTRAAKIEVLFQTRLMLECLDKVIWHTV